MIGRKAAFHVNDFAAFPSYVDQRPMHRPGVFLFILEHEWCCSSRRSLQLALLVTCQNFRLVMLRKRLQDVRIMVNFNLLRITPNAVDFAVVVADVHLSTLVSAQTHYANYLSCAPVYLRTVRHT